MRKFYFCLENLAKKKHHLNAQMVLYEDYKVKDRKRP